MKYKKSDTHTYSNVVRSGFLLAAVLVSLSAAVLPEPLFNDSFSAPAQSHENWISLTADNRQLVFDSGMAHLENGSAIYSGFAIHTLASPLQEFTYSAKLSSPAAGVGVFCCTGNINGTLCGYAVVSGDDELVLLSYDTLGVHQVHSYTTRFPYAMENVLTISGNGSNVAVFCNGFYQFSYPDSFGRPIGVAVVVPPNAAASFDDVSVKDRYTDTLQFPHYFDSLKTIPKYFHQLGNGVVDSGDGYLSISTGKNLCYFAGLDLPVEQVSASVMVRFSDDSAEAGAGFYLGRKDSTLPEGIVPELRVGMTGCGVASVAVSGNGADFSEIYRTDGGTPVLAGTWYCLQFSREGKTIRFSIDGLELLSIERPDTSFFGIGFYTADSGVVDVKGFACEGESAAGTPVVAPRMTRRTVAAKPPSIVDLLGRTAVNRSETGNVLHGSNRIIIHSGEKVLQLRKQ